MKYVDLIESRLESTGGIITSSYCREKGIPTTYLSRLVKKGQLTRHACGVYLSRDALRDDFYLYQLQSPKLVYSFGTALFLFGIGEEIPYKPDVTVYYSYKISAQIRKSISVNYVKPDVYSLGITQVKTAFGNPVQAYCLERTICDFVAYRHKVDSEQFYNLIAYYAQHKTKDLALLSNIASSMNISSKVSNILEIAFACS